MNNSDITQQACYGKLIKSMATVFMLMVCVVGCYRKSTLEGKVVDGKGQPVGGIKIIASQIPLSKESDQCETTTGADGSFKFSKISPNSKYELIPDTDNYLADFGRLTVESGPGGQIKQVPVPMELRFDIHKEGVVIDTKTGLIWARNTNIAIRPMEWTEATSWAQRLNYGDYRDGWRLPTKEELGSFIKTIGFDQIQRHFANVQPYIFYWSSTTWESNKDYAWFIYMQDGDAGDNVKSFKYYAWPVRGELSTVIKPDSDHLNTTLNDIEKKMLGLWTSSDNISDLDASYSTARVSKKAIVFSSDRTMQSGTYISNVFNLDTLPKRLWSISNNEITITDESNSRISQIIFEPDYLQATLVSISTDDPSSQHLIGEKIYIVKHN